MIVRYAVMTIENQRRVTDRFSQITTNESNACLSLEIGSQMSIEGLWEPVNTWTEAFIQEWHRFGSSYGHPYRSRVSTRRPDN